MDENSLWPLIIVVAAGVWYFFGPLAMIAAIVLGALVLVAALVK